MCKSQPSKNEVLTFQKHVQFLKDSGAKKSSLVTYTKFVRRSRNFFRTTMYAMRTASQDIMTLDEQKKWLATDKVPRHTICGRHFSFMNDDVKMIKTQDGHISYQGLAQCRLVWRCPICSFKILERKKQEIYEFYKLQHLSGQKVAFITLTIRHKRKDTLKETIQKLTKNFRKFQNTRWYTKHKHLIKGFIKSTEITYTKTGGWHPHFHFLYFYNHAPTEKLEQFHNEFIKRWATFRNNDAQAIRQDAQFANDDLVVQYIGKWDIVQEIAGNAVKKSKGGKTPFQILKMIALQEYEKPIQRFNLCKLWKEYLTDTKGKPRIIVSKKLKQAYPNIEVKKEEEINEDNVDELLLRIQWQIWLQITKKNLQPHLINFYEKDGITGVLTLLKKANIVFDVNTTTNDELIII